VEKRRRELESAAEEIEQLFADLWQVFPFSRGIRRGYRPEADVYRTEDPPALTIVVELPGVDPNEVKVIASPQALLIAGERRRPKDCGQYQQLEIEYGPFQRRIPLDEPVDTAAATARYETGMLTVELPIAPRPPQTARVSIAIRGRA
jgi:HSP20 family protein